MEGQRRRLWPTAIGTPAARQAFSVVFKWPCGNVKWTSEDATVEAAAAWEAPDERVAKGGVIFYYFDLAVVNQHGQTGVVSFEALRDEFGGGVRGVGHTLFLLRYADPLSLRRAWCVFELGKTLACRARLERAADSPSAPARGP
jgi:hypothetical protein